MLTAGALTANNATQAYAASIQSDNRSVITNLPLSMGDITCSGLPLSMGAIAYAAEDYAAPDPTVAAAMIATATTNAARLKQEAAVITAKANDVCLTHKVIARVAEAK